MDLIMVGTWMLRGNGWSCVYLIMVGTWIVGQSVEKHGVFVDVIDGWGMDDLWKRMESVWTSSWLGHGCCVEADGICVDVITVGTGMLGGNGWGFCGPDHGWDMDPLWERMQSVWTLSWLGHGCCVGTDGVAWTLSWLGHGCSVGTDGVCVDVIMAGTWKLWTRMELSVDHGWDMGARWKRMESVWTSSWLGNGCFVQNRWSLCDVRHHGWDMDARWKRMEFVWS